jgi:hypothetical protein
LAALERRDRGEKIKTGRKDPATDFEAWANFTWLSENHHMTKSAIYNLVAEMKGQAESAVKSRIERIARQHGLGRNIADQVAKETIKRKATPPLLMNRSENWKCVACKMIACSCDRTQWSDTDAGAAARALVGFLDRSSAHTSSHLVVIHLILFYIFSAVIERTPKRTPSS